MTPPLTPIGDIAHPSLTNLTITWETASDWDNAVNEKGVVHESTPETDHQDATIHKKGYRYASPPEAASLEGYWPLHENSGTVAQDVSGNDRDGSLNGDPTLGATGLLGTDAWELDGAGDHFEVPDGTQWETTNITVGLWFRPLSNWGSGTGRLDLVSRHNGPFLLVDFSGDGTIEFLLYNGNPSSVKTTTNSWSAGNWYLLMGTYDGSTQRIYVNGTEENNFSSSFTRASGTGNLHFGENQIGSGNNPDCRMTDCFYWSTALTASQIQDYYDVVAGESFLTTATKSFGSVTTPDLNFLDYTLNGETIILDVIGSPGTGSEETVSQTLDGASSYDLTWATGHTDFRVKSRLSSADPTVTPTVDSISLTA